MTSLTYATRRSALALAQCRAFVQTLERAAELAQRPVKFAELQVVTTGDKIQDRPLSEVGGKGLFVKEIEEALLDGRAQLAVHSIKDVPSDLPPGLTLACIPPRVDPRDVLVSPKYGTLADLPTGAIVGTSSLRRSLALRRLRPDLEIRPLRGNVDTRLSKVDAGDYDAIVLAAAGLARLGLSARVTDALAPELFVPAVGQGALGIECRDDDVETKELLARVHDEESAMCVEAERGVLRALGGDCKTPIAAHAVRSGRSLTLAAWVSELDGSLYRFEQRQIDFPVSSEVAAAFGVSIGEKLRHA